MSVKKKKKKINIFVYSPRACKYLSILHGTTCAFCISMWKEKYVTMFTQHLQQRKLQAFCYFPYLIALPKFGQSFLELLL